MNHLGIDFGGVIVLRSSERQGEDTTLSRSAGAQAEYPGAIDAIRRLVEVFEGRVSIVSKAGTRMQQRTVSWLYSVGFEERTGVDRSRIHFCKERAAKAAICGRLGITHFVDDRIEVIQNLRHTVPHLYLFGSDSVPSQCPPWAKYITDWQQLEAAVLRSLADRRPEADGSS